MVATAKHADGNKLAAKLTARFYTPTQLESIIGVSRQMLGVYCSKGLVPHARMLGGEWIIAKAGAIFIARWLEYREDLGSLWKRTVSRSAVNHDPACVVRQQNKKQLQLEDVLAIRQRVADGEQCCDIAREFELDQSTVYYIGVGRSYPLPARFEIPDL